MEALRHHIIVNDVHFLKISQPLSGSRAQLLEQQLLHLVGLGAGRLVINLADVPFMDSRGLAALVAALRALGENSARLQLVSPQPQPALVFELTGYDRIFQITDEAEAMPLAA